MAFLIFRVSLACTMLLSVVLPNSLQATTAALLVVCALSSALVMEKSKHILKIFALYGVSLFVTFAYVLVGVIRGATSEAVFQVITIYAISPLLWILVSIGISSRIHEKVFSKWISFLVIAAAISVAIFFYLFINYGAESVSFFIETANVNLNDGYVGATMSVYGSFIFLTGAIFASPTIIRNSTLRIVCLVAVLVVVVTSGRSALILSMLVGASIYILFRRVGRVGKSSVGGGLAILIVLLFALGAYFYISSIDLNLIFQLFFEELSSGGGQERVEQAIALLDATADTWALGAGHGIGVEYVRSDVYPWRYELVWFATLYRVGLIGFLIYFLPVLFYFSRFFWFFRKRLLSRLDIFMFGGFFCALIASNTNPYIEAYVFQWMYVIPFVFLMLKPRASVNTDRADDLT